jgi:ComF family protein
MIALRSAFDTWCDPLFPPHCAACDLVGTEPFCRICSEAVIDGSKVSLRGFGVVRALWLYGGPVRDAIQRMKYDRKVEIARALSMAIPKSLFDPHRFDLIVSVPLSRPRLRQRRFNPAFEICRHSPVPVEHSALLRLGIQPSQVGLGPQQRRQNVQHVFTAKNPRNLRGKRVLLVDDVMTTGATLFAAGQVLRVAGVSRLEALVLARADTEDPNIICV